ncbi:MAG: aminotransferase class I/II-fold pyridoxal phosphate-dependent enzyme [Pseudomonadota bacterium]
MLKVSNRSAVAPFHAMDVFAKATRLAANGADVISLAVGQPSAQAPQLVREAAAKAALEANISYTNALGRDELRQAIAAHYADAYGLDIPASRAAVTTGSSAAFSLAFLALTEPGGRVAITAPGYPAYRNIIRALSLDCVELETVDGGFDVDALKAAHLDKPIDVLLLASPANPTGSVLSEAELRAIMAACAEAGIVFISDEIYHRLNFTADDVCAASISDDAIIINSFSKYYCMTGWRIGWMIVPEAMVRTIERLAQSLYISAPDIAQRAAMHAFDATGELDAIRDTYRANRQLLVEQLPAMGLPFAAPPDGAFYAWMDVSRYTDDSMAFAHRMLDEIHVAVAPGIDFDPYHGDHRLRMSYCGSQDQVSVALSRMSDWLSLQGR